MKHLLILVSLSILGGLLILFSHFESVQSENTKPQLWQIRSVDTMKNSRDKARAELFNNEYDEHIEKELKAIKGTGANYVALGTPYDEEFMPYLLRWVKLARKNDLKIWFRGNWSSWEGWFDYPKNLTPQQHIQKTDAFIRSNPSLFRDGDIFDACPECENAGYWKQPEKNAEYNIFVRQMYESNKKAFIAIDRDVSSNLQAIIGGRAKEVLDRETLQSLGDVVAIDHYVKSPEVMQEFIDYFAAQNTKVVISEFGAPVPGINPSMSEEEQATFVKTIFDVLYAKKASVMGVNYYVSMVGTTPLLNDDFTPRIAYQVVKNYYSPLIIKGSVINSLGDRMKDITIATEDGRSTVQTNGRGEYAMATPQGKQVIRGGSGEYTEQVYGIHSSDPSKTIIQNFVVDPRKPGLLYRLRSFFSKIF